MSCDSKAVVQKSPNSIYFRLLNFSSISFFSHVYLAPKSQSHSIFCPLLILIYIEYLNGILNTHLVFFLLLHAFFGSAYDKINENKRKKKTLDK